MRRYIAFLILLVFVASLVPTAYADGPVDKLGRGLVNILFSPKELFEPSEELKGTTDNVGTRFSNFLYRAGVGIVEVATFPIPVPEDYGPIIGRETYVMKGRYDVQEPASIRRSKEDYKKREALKTQTL